MFLEKYFKTTLSSASEHLFSRKSPDGRFWHYHNANHFEQLSGLETSLKIDSASD